MRQVVTFELLLFDINYTFYDVDGEVGNIASCSRQITVHCVKILLL